MSELKDNRKPKTAKEKQADKMRQEMARRKEAEETKKREIAAKKKKTTIIFVSVLCVIVIVAIAVGVPLGIRAKGEYKTYDFQTFAIPTTAEAARKTSNTYNGQKCVFEGYLTTCNGLDYLVLCKTKIECPYANGNVPSDGIIVKKSSGSPFTTKQVNTFAKVYGTLVVNSQTVSIDGNNTYVYMEVDKVELTD